MKIVGFLFLMLFLPPICLAKDAESSYPPGYVSIKGAEFLVMLAAYEAFKKDQKSADISKFKVALFNEEDGSVSVLFGYPPKYHYGPDGKLLSLELNADAGKYGVAVAYYVDPKTNKVIKRVYQR